MNQTSSKHRKHTFFRLCILTLTAAALFSCSLQEVENRGETCPPKDAAPDAVLAYIGTPDNCSEDSEKCDFPQNLANKTCPIEYKHCLSSDDTTYFCAESENAEAPCQSGFMCDDRCIDKPDDLNCGQCGKSCKVSPYPHSKGGKCVEDDNAFTCEYECQNGFTNCGTAFVPICTDLNSTEYCGSCNNSCKAGFTCRDSKCSDYPCDETCKTQLYPNAKAGKCTVGDNGPVCEYSCESDYTNCGSDEIPNCINSKENKKHCGKCDNPCADNEYCINGTCTETPCTGKNSGYCYVDEKGCIQDDQHCGPSCTNCEESGQLCISGACRDKTCPKDQHFYYDSDAHTAQCEPNQPTKCSAKSDNESNDDIKNCNEVIVGSTKTECDSGSCKVISCAKGYHIYNNTCEKDDVFNCGEHGFECDIAEVRRANEMACPNGQCIVSKCSFGYYISSDKTLCLNEGRAHCGDEKCSSSKVCIIKSTTSVCGTCTHDWEIIKGSGDEARCYVRAHNKSGDLCYKLDTVSASSAENRACLTSDDKGVCVKDSDGDWFCDTTQN